MMMDDIMAECDLEVKKYIESLFKYKIGDVVTGTLLFGNGDLYEGTVVKQDAGISRDAVIVELANGERHIILESAILNNT